MANQAPPRSGTGCRARRPCSLRTLAVAAAAAMALACGGGAARDPGSPAAEVTVSLSPRGPVTLGLSASRSFTVAVTGTGNTAVTWTVDGLAGGSAAAGTLAGTGATVTYTSPATAGTHTVTATSAADPGRSASAVVTVAAQAVQVALNPAGAVSVAVAGTQAFTATVTGTADTRVTWKVDGRTGGDSEVGTLAGAGATVTYTAPSAAGTHTVTAASVADPSRTASATVTVQAPAAVRVALALVGPANVVASGATLLTATVGNADDPGVTWSVDGVTGGNAGTGRIRAPVGSRQVVYQAPAATGPHTVTATSIADPGQSASVTLAVTASAAQAGTIPVGANVRDAAYGAAGDGASDDTAAINKAVRAVAGTGRAVFVPAGTYMIRATGNNGAGILLASDMALVLDPGATFRAFPTTTPHYELVRAEGVRNLVISGGTYAGNNGANSIPTPTTVEDGNGIQILGCSNVVVEDVVTTGCFCDGIYVAEGSRNVVISNATSVANRRHGMAVVNASGVLVLGGDYSGNTGSVEQAGGPMVNGCGIDIEANAYQDIRDVLVHGATLSGNRLAGLGWGVGAGTAAGSSTGGIFVVGNTVTGNGHGLDGENCPDSAILDNEVADNSAFGIYIHHGATGTVCAGNSVRNTGSAGDGAGIMCYKDTGTRVDGNLATGNSRYGIYLVESTGAAVTGNTATGNGTAGIVVTRSSGVTQSGNVTQ